MTKITIDDVRKGIMKQINTFRDKDTTGIYSEDTPQDFKEPCFFIKEVRSSQTKELGNRYKRGNLYNIRYFPNPDSNSRNQEMRDIAEIMYGHMEFIEINNKLAMGQELNHQIIDGVLHFFVKYPLFLYKEMPKIPYMENLYQKGDIKRERKS